MVCIDHCTMLLKHCRRGLLMMQSVGRLMLDIIIKAAELARQLPASVLASYV